MRSKLIAENILSLMKNNSKLADSIDMILPGIGKRLTERPYEALESLTSFEVLLTIVRYIDETAADSLLSAMARMVDQHAGLFSSSDKYSDQVMSLLPESPMWNSIFWQATNIIVGKPIEQLTTMLPDPCALKLRCNSKTAQGLPMTVAAYFEISDSTETISNTLRENLQFYSGKSLTDISTSAWSNIVLLKESVQGSIACQDRWGEKIRLDFDANELDQTRMALSYIICNDTVGNPGIFQHIFKTQPPWIPSDGDMQWRCSDPSEDIYEVKTKNSATYTHEISGATVYGIVECLDALALIDSQFSLGTPRLG